MIFRTDLAKESIEFNKNEQGLINKKFESFGVKGDFVNIVSDEYAKKIGKKVGKYVSFETDAVINRETESFENISRAIAEEIKELLGEEKGSVLIVGLGNEEMTPDSIGPKVIKKILVTRHLFEFLPEATDSRMAKVCAFAPGVLGVTGIESKDIIQGICNNTEVNAIIVIDALAARRSERMFSTFQITDTGIEPGAGVGNKRSAFSKEALGIPVIAIGVPTVIYASSLVYDAVSEMLSMLTGQKEENIEDAAQRFASFSSGDMVVTPKEIDVIAEDCAKIIADGINLALHNDMSIEEINSFVF